MPDAMCDGAAGESAAEMGLASGTFELPQELDDRTRAGVAEVCQLMGSDGLSFDEARLQIVFSRMAQMGVDESGMPTDPKTFTFDQVRTRGEVPTPWRRESQRRRCLDVAGDRTPKGIALGALGLGLGENRRLDWKGLVPHTLTKEELRKTLRGPSVWLVSRVMLLGFAAMLMIVLGAREGGAASLPGMLVQDGPLLPMSP